jgi:pimeloyl-ACP methyl ester carboxylesterase
VLARVGIVRLALSLLTAGSRRLPRIFARVSSGNGAPFTERIVGEISKLPPETWPDIQEHWCQPKSFESLAEHLANLPANAAACRSQCDLGDLPLVVLSAADSTPSRAAEHARMAGSSTRGRLLTAAKSGHWILLDEPELVVSAIRGLPISVP